MVVLNARQVTSLANETVKHARALHMRKTREESGQFLAEGLKIITEAVDQGVAPEVLMFGKAAASHPLLIRAAEATARPRGQYRIRVLHPDLPEGVGVRHPQPLGRPGLPLRRSQRV